MECTVAAQQIDGWWIGWVEEIPGVNCQERTYQELIDSIKEGIIEIVALNRQKALEQAGAHYKEEKITVNL